MWDTIQHATRANLPNLYFSQIPLYFILDYSVCIELLLVKVGQLIHILWNKVLSLILSFNLGIIQGVFFDWSPLNLAMFKSLYNSGLPALWGEDPNLGAAACLP